MNKYIVTSAVAIIVLLAIASMPGCTSAQQAAVTNDQATVKTDTAAANAAQAVAATQPTTANIQAATDAVNAEDAAIQKLTADTAALTAAQTQQSQLVATGTSIASTAANGLPAPWNLIAIAALGAAATYFGVGKSQATAAANTAQTQVATVTAAHAATTAQLVAHQIALAAVSGSTAPLTTTTTISHPALTPTPVTPGK